MLQAVKNIKFQICFLIVAVTFLIYGKSIQNNYALDDLYVTVTTPNQPNNPRIQKGVAGISEIFKTHYIETDKQRMEYRPLVLTSFAIEYEFFGSNPHVSHFISILLYALTGVILFLCLSLLFKDYGLLFPALVTLLFIVHPVHTEVVYNTKSRDELFSFLFGILSLFYMIKYCDTKKTKNIMLCCIFLFLAFLSKKSSLVFIYFIPFVVYFFNYSSVKQTLKVFGLMIGIWFCFIVFEYIMLTNETVTREFVFFENPLFYDTSLNSKLLLSLYSLGYYIKLLIVPFPLTSYYGYNVIPILNWSNVFILLSLFFHVFIFTYAVFKFKKRIILSFAIFAYLIGIFPFSNLVQPLPGIIGERFVYFASLGFCIAMITLLFKVFKFNFVNKEHLKNKTKIITLSVSVILILFSVLSFSRGKTWKDEETLLSSDVKVAPNSCNLHFMLGNIYYTKSFNTQNQQTNDFYKEKTIFHFKKAIEYMEEGLKLYPTDLVNQNNLGTIYVNVFNDFDKAQLLFKKIIKNNPSKIEARYNYAFCFEKKNLADSAIFYYEKLFNDYPTYLLNYNQLTELCFKQDEPNRVIKNSALALLKNPNESKIYIDLGNAYLYVNDTIHSFNYFDLASTKFPQNNMIKQRIIKSLKTYGFNQKASFYEKTKK